MTNKNGRTKTGTHTKTKTKTLNIVDEKKLSTILMTLSLTKTKTLGVIERFSDYDNPLKNVIFNRTFENPLRVEFYCMFENPLKRVGFLLHF